MDLDDIFGPDGPLARTLPGYTPRPGQVAMAHEVAAALAGRETLIVEAGTGTGKTYAYLVPALLSGRRVIVSTGTRALQDQLYHRDLPAICAALGRPASVALLKGRANYLCRHRLELATQQAWSRGLRSEVASLLPRVQAWSATTRRGDIADLAGVGEADPVWPWVTSTRENCLGAECPRFEDCCVVGARREAQAADIVVVNHHLLMADLVLKEEGFGELLPGADAIVVDEAHQLPEIAPSSWGSTSGRGRCPRSRATSQASCCSRSRWAAASTPRSPRSMHGLRRSSVAFPRGRGSTMPSGRTALSRTSRVSRRAPMT
jgi:ATP-dependent DNA helicase DinG